MPPLLMTMPSAPIIIPLTVVVVVISVFVLLVYYYLKRAIGCPHKTSTYRTSNAGARKSVLPSSPYEINERESTASPSSSIFFNQSGKAVLLYPALSSSRSTPNNFDERSRVTFRDEPHVHQHDSDNDSLPGLVTPEPTINREDNLIMMESRSASASPGGDNQESPMPYEEVQETTTYRTQMSYQRTEQSFLTFDASVEPHFESDNTMLGNLREKLQSAIQYELPSGLRDLRLTETITSATVPILKSSSSALLSSSSSLPSSSVGVSSVPLSSSSPSSSSSSSAATAAAAASSSLLKMTLKNAVPRSAKGTLFMGVVDEPENSLSVDQSAGKEMVEHFQASWLELQGASQTNAKQAYIIGAEIDKINEHIQRTHQAFHNFVSDSSDLSSIVRALSDIDNEIHKCSRLCASLEDAITDLDKEFESIDFLMRQRESECRLKELMNRRDEDLVVLRTQLQALNEQKIKDKARKEAEISRERQRVFQEVFEAEVAQYKSGTLPVKSKKHDGHESKLPDSELLDIDVADEHEVAALEDFLAS